VRDRVAVALATQLRTAGLDVPVSSTVAFASALQVIDVERRRDVYWAARATLVRRLDDVATFDRVFARCFGGGAGPPAAEPIEVSVTLALDAEQADAPSPTRFSLPDRWSPCATARTRCSVIATSRRAPPTSCTKPTA
jgi:uncharacterized protein with von Willebrand factor type A (vWA) domain